MILTAGQQEQGHGLTEPLLYDPLVPIAEPLVKWAVEVTRLEDLPRIVRRAAKVAMTPPTGPVFISLPGDILNAEAGIELGASTRVETRTRPADAVLDTLGQAAAAGRAAGDHRRRRDRQERRAGRPRPPSPRRWALPSISRARPTARIFSPSMPAIVGSLSRDQKQVRGAAGEIRPADRARRRSRAHVGVERGRAAARRTCPWSTSACIDWDMGKNFAAELAVRADLRETLLALTPVLAQESAASGSRPRAKAALAAARARELDAPSAQSLAARLERRAKAKPIDYDWLTPADRQGAAARCRGRQRGPHLGAPPDGSRALSRPLRLPRAGLRRHRLGPAGRGRRGAGAGAAARVLLSPATAAPCTRSRRCGRPPITSCRSPTSSPTTAAIASSSSASAPSTATTTTSAWTSPIQIDFAALAKSHGHAGRTDHRARCGAGGAAARLLDAGPKLLDVVVEGRY